MPGEATKKTKTSRNESSGKCGAIDDGRKKIYEKEARRKAVLTRLSLTELDGKFKAEIKLTERKR